MASPVKGPTSTAVAFTCRPLTCTGLSTACRVKWKHVMHLIRLLLSGISIMREGFVPVRVEEHREKLLAIRRGEMPWEEVEDWRKRLHHEFNAASEATKLPERPDYEQANAFLI